MEWIPVITEATSNIDDIIEQRQEQLEQQVQQIEKERIEALENGPKIIRKDGLTSKESIEDNVKEEDIIFISAFAPYRKSYVVECIVN